VSVISRRISAVVATLLFVLLSACDNDEPTIMSERNVSISGTVLDSSDNAPVPSVLIVHFFIDPADSSTIEFGSTTTDSTGAYRISMPYAPDGWLSFEAPGYRQEQYELEQCATQTGLNSYTLNVLLGRLR
jgi:hypothetical protein